MRAVKYPFSILDPVEEFCEGDVNGDGAVNVNDILEVIGAYGSSDGSGDADNDGDADTNDVLTVLAAWGTDCP